MTGPSSSAPASGNPFLGATDGMDSIQAFKAQMKEMERKEREQAQASTGGGRTESGNKESAVENGSSAKSDDVRSTATGTTPSTASTPSVFEHLTSSNSNPSPATSNNTGDFSIPGSKDARPSVFDNLGLGTGITGVSTGSTSHPGEGGRSSRFAKFFDGKPPATTPSTSSSAPAKSVFDSLIGAPTSQRNGTGGQEASKGDQESMNRLLGMLQLSGVSLIGGSFPFSSVALRLGTYSFKHRHEQLLQTPPSFP